MEGLSNEAAYSGTAIKTTEIGSYETGKSGACKTWYVSPNASTKGYGNKVRSYTITDLPGAYKTQHLTDNNETPTVMVHVLKINKTITLPLPTE